ncbi:MAG: HAD-IIB family hydrolase [Candidatus Sumerlaeota bacterium]
MQPVTALSSERLSRVEGVFADIDETISTRGKLTAEAYGAMWRLHEAGVKVVPVTGRAAGWCDHIGRFWPVDAVVGENGGFYFYHDGEKLIRRFLHNDAMRRDFRSRLEAVRKQVMHEIPGAGIASDQHYREYDLAIDFCEDVAPLEKSQIHRIQDIFEEHGAHAKISSIHVNGWFGDFDKLSTARLCASELFDIELDRQSEKFVFMGDSPNDEPMFGFFPLSFAMANIEPFLEMIEAKPAYVATKESGAGFVEVANRILDARQ